MPCSAWKAMRSHFAHSCELLRCFPSRPTCPWLRWRGSPFHPSLSDEGRSSGRKRASLTKHAPRDHPEISDNVSCYSFKDSGIFHSNEVITANCAPLFATPEVALSVLPFFSKSIRNSNCSNPIWLSSMFFNFSRNFVSVKIVAES